MVGWIRKKGRSAKKNKKGRILKVRKAKGVKVVRRLI